MMKVLDFLYKIHPISAELKNELAAKLQYIAMKKGETLLKKGSISNKIYFIEKGLFRAYYLKEDKEVNAWFMKENDVIIAVFSFFKQVPSMETIEALEDAQLWFITHDELVSLYNQYIEFNIVGRILTAHYYMLSEERNYIMRNENAEFRYNYFIENYADLLNRIPLYHIASYLGVSAETLSRIRNQKMRPK